MSWLVFHHASFIFCFFFPRGITECVPTIRHSNVKSQITVLRLSACVCLPALGKSHLISSSKRGTDGNKEKPSTAQFYLFIHFHKNKPFRALPGGFNESFRHSRQKNAHPEWQTGFKWLPEIHLWTPIRTPEPLIGSSNQWPKGGLRYSWGVHATPSLSLKSEGGESPPCPGSLGNLEVSSAQLLLTLQGLSEELRCHCTKSGRAVDANDPPSEGHRALPGTGRLWLPIGCQASHLLPWPWCSPRHQEHSRTRRLRSHLYPQPRPSQRCWYSLKAYTRDWSCHEGSHRGQWHTWAILCTWDLRVRRLKSNMGNTDRLWDKMRKKNKGSDDRPQGKKNPSSSWPLSWGQMDSPRAPALSPSWTPSQANGQRASRAPPPPDRNPLPAPPSPHNRKQPPQPPAGTKGLRQRHRDTVLITATSHRRRSTPQKHRTCPLLPSLGLRWQQQPVSG